MIFSARAWPLAIVQRMAFVRRKSIVENRTHDLRKV